MMRDEFNSNVAPVSKNRFHRKMEEKGFTTEPETETQTKNAADN